MSSQEPDIAANDAAGTAFWRPQLRHADSDLPVMAQHTFYAPPLSDGATVLDLGAAMAEFSHAVAHLFGCRCYAVEATAHGFRDIIETDLVSRHHYAICGDDGPVPLWIAADDVSWGSVRPSGDFDYRDTGTVPGTTLETFLAEIGVAAPDLVKVDIEGAEFAMFEATADATLQNMGQVSVEFHDFMNPEWVEPTARIKERMADLGFEVFSYSGRFNADVLFLNRRVANLGPWHRFRLGTLTKYRRGARRFMDRHLQR